MEKGHLQIPMERFIVVNGSTISWMEELKPTWQMVAHSLVNGLLEILMGAVLYDTISL